MRPFLYAGLFGLALTGSAFATPTIEIAAFDNGVQMGATYLSNTGSASVAYSDSNFDLSIVAAGVPALPNPNLAAITLNVSSHTLPSPIPSLIVEVTQTGLSEPAPINLASSFTFNALTATGSSADFQNFVDTSNTAFAMTTPITPMITLTPAVGDAGPIISQQGALGLFSETEYYKITFGGASQAASLDAQIINAPEPMSLALMGAGLTALGIARMRKRA